MPGKLTKVEIDEFLGNLEYKLLDDYRGASKKNKILCIKHGVVNNSMISDLRQGHLLKCCGIEKVKEKLTFTIEEVREACKGKNIEFVSQSYGMAKDKYEFKCLIHDKIYRSTFLIVNNGHNLKCCGNEAISESKRYSLKEVREDCLSRGFEYLETSHEHLQDHSSFRCLKHNETHISTWASIKIGRGIKCCRKELMSGENNPNYNSALTKEERENKSRPEGRLLDDWRRKVYERDGFACVLCSGKHNLNAHHIFNYRHFPGLRLTLENGISLCEMCHIGFHSMFGNFRNTRNEFNAFVEINANQKV